MKDQLISFETAQLAKEKGFDIPTNTVYQHNEQLHTTNSSDHYPHLSCNGRNEEDYFDGFSNWNIYNTDEEDRFCMVNGFNESDEDFFTVCASAPTQSLLQRYLREKHNIDVQITRNKPRYKEYKAEIYADICDGPYKYIYFNVEEEETGYIKWFRKYEEALEDGLQCALKLIKEK